MSQILAAVRTDHAELAAKMAEVEVAQTAGEDVKKLFDGTLVKWLIAYVKAHPEQAVALVQWILAMFGIVIPIPPLPADAE